MSTTLERIKTEIRGLSHEEIELLLRDLHDEYVEPVPSNDDEASVAAEWDMEIEARAQEVAQGRVMMIPGVEAERMIDAMFTQRGMERRTA